MFLKDIDIYGVPIKTYFHKYDDGLTSSITKDVMGSYFGGIVSIFVVIVMFVYLTMMLVTMANGDNDILNKSDYANPFDEEYGKIELD